MSNYIKLSKHISRILRHEPEIIGLKLDENGWLNVDELLAGINNEGRYIDKKILDEIVATNNKKRFRYNDDQTKIRANQGHSVQVDVELVKRIPPDVLYHGTAGRFLESIKQTGIKKMKRLYVHLSKDIKTAIDVGKRHGKPIVLVIDTKAMRNDGYQFYYSDNKVWLCDDIDYKYVKEVIE